MQRRYGSQRVIDCQGLHAVKHGYGKDLQRLLFQVCLAQRIKECSQISFEDVMQVIQR